MQLRADDRDGDAPALGVLRDPQGFADTAAGYGEVETSRLDGGVARAVLLVAVAGATDRKLGAASTAPLETDSIDTSATRAFALRGTAGLHDDFGVAHHVGHHGNDQIELDADVQRSA